MNRRKLLPLACAACLLMAVVHVHMGNFFDAGAFILLFVGATSNALAIYGNGGRMPVYGELFDATDTHVPASRQTRYGWCCDRIDVGFGVASVGDLVAWFAWLLCLISIGLHLWRGK